MATRIAGVYFSSGKTSQFTASVLEHFEVADRWIFDSLYLSSEDKNFSADTFEKWVQQYNITDVVFNFPISGERNCSEETVNKMKQIIGHILERDSNYEKKFPKEYERSRTNESVYKHKLNVFPEKNRGNFNLDKYPKVPLNKSLKKKLKKGITPYWNRPIDLYIWLNYHPELIHLFNYSYDSFGHTSLMNIKRLNYLRKYMQNINLWESNVYINFLELLRAKILETGDLIGMKYTDEYSVASRQSIISKVVDHLNLKIKEEDFSRLIFDPKAINSFMMSLSVVSKVGGKTILLPNYCHRDHTDFLIPSYL